MTLNLIHTDHVDLEGLPRKRWIAVAERAVAVQLGGGTVEIEERSDEEKDRSQLPLFDSNHSGK